MIGVKEAENASSIDSTEAGMVIEERLHELNDHKGKDVRDSDNVMFDRFVQLSNDHIPIYTTEFGITTSFNPVNHISLSAKVKLGDRGRAEIARKVDEWYIDGLQKYTEGDYEGAIESWNKSLLLNAGFDPAKKGIAIALRQQQLVEKIKEMQSLD